MVVYASCSLASATRVSAVARSTSAGRSGCSRRASRTRARTCSVVRPVPQMTSGSTARGGQRGRQRLGGVGTGPSSGSAALPVPSGGSGAIRSGAKPPASSESAPSSSGEGCTSATVTAASGSVRGGVGGRRRAEQGVERAAAGRPRLGHAGQPDDAVAAAALGVVEDAVGGGEQRAAVVAAGGRGDADADRHRDVEAERPTSRSAATLRRVRSSARSACSAVVSGSRMTNSSPAQRHTSSVSRTPAIEQLGRPSRRTASPPGWPIASLIDLNRSTSTTASAGARAGRQQPVEAGLGVAAVGQVGERVLVGLAAQLAGGPLGLQQALAPAEQLDPAGAPLVDPVQLVGEVGLQVGQRAAGVVELGVQRAQLAQRGPAQPGQAVLGGQGERGDQVLVGGAAVALPAQRPAQRQLRGGQLGAVGGGRGDADGGAQRADRGGVLAEPDQRPAVHDLGGRRRRGSPAAAAPAPPRRAGGPRRSTGRRTRARRRPAAPRPARRRARRGRWRSTATSTSGSPSSGPSEPGSAAAAVADSWARRW